MTHDPASDGFASRLDLALKAMNLSRAHLAAAVGVDKSVVSRWLSGQAIPSGHNLARIGEVLAKTRPGFNSIAWDRPLAEFKALLGVAPAPEAPPAAPSAFGTGALSLAVHSFSAATDAARREIGRRGDAYDGLWEMLRPSFMQPGKFVRDQAIIHRRDGLLHIRQGGQGFECTGWLLMIQSQIYGLLADMRDDSLLLMIANSVNMPRVESTNGLMMAVTSDRFQTPTASPVYWRRAADLVGDEEADRKRYDERRATLPNFVDSAEIDVGIRALLLPDIGPAAFAAGGEMLLRALYDPAISRGEPARLVTK